MTTSTQITKLINAAGYVYNCSCCGKEIKNVFQVGTKVYGSECVINLFGAYGENKVKEINSLVKAYNKSLQSTKDTYKALHGYNDEQMLSHFLRNKGFN